MKSEYTYYTQNAHGDVVNLTDDAGAVSKSYTYDAFGVEVNPSTGDVNVFRFCGEYFHTESGTIYLRARYYQASIGRFTQRDSFAGRNTDPLSLNKYTYCANNPVRFTDPQGLDYYYYYGEDQAEDAAVNIAELENVGETVHSYKITSDDELEQNWNAMNSTEDDSIVINLHGNSTGVSHMDLSKMKNKTASYTYCSPN